MKKIKIDYEYTISAFCRVQAQIEQASPQHQQGRKTSLGL